MWLDTTGRPTAVAQRTVAFIRGLDSLGLAPADFELAALDSFVERANLSSLTPEEQGGFESLMSVSTARLLSALRWGRVTQPQAYPKLKRTRDDYDLAAGIYATARTAMPSAVIGAAEPPFVGYRRLRQAVAHTLRLAADPVLDSVADPPVRRGMPLARGEALRNVLVAVEALPDSLGRASAGDTVLSADLIAGLQRFKRARKGAPPPVLDNATRRALRRALQSRLTSASLALERWRWLPRTPQGRAIVVNVPEFKLRVYDDVRATPTPAFEMKVVVGRGVEDRYTPLFVEEMEHVIFSPYWEVPQTIAKDEIVPKLLSDSTYLKRNRYVLVRGYSENAPQVNVDSATIAAVGRSVRVRQLPGDYNSLGRVKFMLPNDMNIYLHDTNEKHFFSRSARALSHGCVRVSDPKKLAEWVLSGDSVWTPERMKTAMKAAAPEKVELSAHIPVMLVYHTASSDDTQAIRTFTDVYKYDGELAKLLARGFPYQR
jgi:murein L,D-transpeptidase YcbB/YkuD